MSQEGGCRQHVPHQPAAAGHRQQHLDLGAPLEAAAPHPAVAWAPAALPPAAVSLKVESVDFVREALMAAGAPSTTPAAVADHQSLPASVGPARDLLAAGWADNAFSRILFAQENFLSAFSLEVRQRVKHMVPLFVEGGPPAAATAAMQGSLMAAATGGAAPAAAAAGGAATAVWSSASWPHAVAVRLPLVPAQDPSSAPGCRAAGGDDDAAAAAGASHQAGDLGEAAAAVIGRGQPQQRELCRHQQGGSRHWTNCNYHQLPPTESLAAAAGHLNFDTNTLADGPHLLEGNVTCSRTNKRRLDPACQTARGGLRSSRGRSSRAAAAAASARLAANKNKASEFADLVAMKSHLPSAEFRSVFLFE